MSTAYETDFYGWALEQARAVRIAGAARISTPAAIGWENVAEELEALDRAGARRDPDSSERESGLLPRCEEIFEVGYGLARREAARQANLSLTTFPETSPFTLDQAIDGSLWPD